jgi:hypothetical protein
MRRPASAPRLSAYHAPTDHRRGRGPCGEKKPAVVFVMENRFSPVATRHQVLKRTGKLKTEASTHGEKLGKRQICQDLHPGTISTPSEAGGRA